MKICIPTTDDAGLDSQPFGHFGSAPYFTLVDVDAEKVEVLNNGNQHHAHGTCHPLRQLGGYGIGAVVCRGLGRRAIASLEANGIDVLITGESTVRGVVEAFRSGRLRKMSPAEACAGHGHGAGGCGHHGH
jgi:predicted Fe-Mo cluster-binding NifX family protein